MIKENNFDDYLELLNYDFSEYKYIIFIGNSGSGKTSYINKILNNNKYINDKVFIIDEIFDIFDFFKIFINLLKNKQFIIASHISHKYFYILKSFGKMKIIYTDKNMEKIFKYLQFKNLTYSRDIIEKFIKLYGATYTDIDIILENYKGNNFDEAFNYFSRFNKLTLTGNKKKINYGKNK